MMMIPPNILRAVNLEFARPGTFLTALGRTAAKFLVGTAEGKTVAVFLDGDHPFQPMRIDGPSAWDGLEYGFAKIEVDPASVRTDGYPAAGCLSVTGNSLSIAAIPRGFGQPVYVHLSDLDYEGEITGKEKEMIFNKWSVVLKIEGKDDVPLFEFHLT